MPLVHKETKKLFYNKWIYKIGLNIQGCAVLRMKSGQALEDFLSELPFSFPAVKYSGSLQARAMNSKNTLIKLNFLLQSYEKKTYSTRIEGDFFDVYTNNKTIISEIQEEFDKYVRLISKPKVKNIDLLLKNEHSIFVSSLPKEKYGYRVYLKPHRVDQDKKSSFLSWLETQGDATSISPSLADWFTKCSMNWDRRYILVDNDKTLLMIKLHTPDAVGTVYKYQLTDK